MKGGVYRMLTFVSVLIECTAFCKYLVYTICVSCKHGINFVKDRLPIDCSWAHNRNKIGAQYGETMSIIGVQRL